MASTFAKSSFSYTGYASARPQYTALLYNKIFDFHRGPCDRCIDIGTGHGLVSRYLSSRFKRVTAIDPSRGMLDQARKLTPQTQYPNVSFEQGTSDNLPTDHGAGTVDMVVAAQAAHWFDFDRTWPEIATKLRPGGTVAFWGYVDFVFPNHPRANEIVHHSPHVEALNRYFAASGTRILEDRYHAILPPDQYFTDIKRLECYPKVGGAGSGEGTLIMSNQMTLSELKAYARTWSATHEWQEANPESSRERDGDVVDWLFEELAASEEAFKDPSFRLTVEWGTVLLMARRK